MASSSAGQKSLDITLGDGQHIIVLVNRSHSLPTDDTISYGFKSHSNRPWEGPFSIQRDPYLQLHGAKFDHNNGSIDIKTVASGNAASASKKARHQRHIDSHTWGLMSISLR